LPKQLLSEGELFMQQQQGNANTTPDRNLLSDKELHYLKDFLSWELLAMKKCGEAASTCQDPQLAQVIRDAGKQHQRHYESILTHLQG
jgi:hypothetical protein